MNPAAVATPHPFPAYPTTFGGLLRKGIEAIEAVEEHPRMRVQLNHVHTPVTQRGKFVGTIANLAGALLASSGSVAIDVPVSMGNLTHAVRMAYIATERPDATQLDCQMWRNLTYVGVGLHLPKSITDFAPTPYLHDPDQWKADMLTLADIYDEEASH